METAGVELDRIGKRYADVVACQDLSVHIRPGQLFGLTGGRGAGKTTALRIVVGLLAADTGRVLLSGEPVTMTTRRRIGYLPARRGLYPRMKVLDHLVYLAELHGMGANDAHRSAENWIGRLSLREARDLRVDRLAPDIAHRVALAAALVHGPEALVADEPFAAAGRPVADSEAELVGGVLHECAAAGLPVLLSSAQPDQVERFCDRAGVLRAGTMVASGTIAQLRAHGEAELIVDVPGATDDWAGRLPGVRVLEVHNGRVRLRTPATVDDQTVLATALAAGPVREFTRREPTLAEVFADELAPVRR